MFPKSLLKRITGLVSIFSLVLALTPAPADAAGLSFAGAVGFSAGGNPNSVATADLNGDGKLDLAVANRSSDNVSVSLNATSPGAATPSFAATVNFAVGSHPYAVVAADLNGDGKPDLAVGNRSSNTVSVLLNTTSPGSATPSFAAAVNLAAGNDPGSLAVADLNGDGKPDLAVANYASSNVSVLLNTSSPGAATPTFAAAVNLAAGNGPRSVAAADLNGDGRPDLAVGNYDGNNVSVLLNTTSPGAATPSFAAAVNFAAGDGPLSVVAADLNGDGRPDLATGNYDGNNVSVLLNTTSPGAATPSFVGAVNFAAGVNSGSVATADLNGDGKPDLAVGNYGSDNVSALLSTTSPGAATPSFAAAVNFAAGDGSGSVAAADLNGDGRPDLFTGNYDGNNVSVLLNTSASAAAAVSFAGAASFTAGSNPYSVATADLNGDGKPDVAVANRYSDNVSVLLNTTSPGAAAPSFAARANFAVGSHPYKVVAADLNGDGRPDLAVANRYSNSISVLLNTTSPGAATPSFAGAVNFAAGDDSGYLVAADLNGDGKPDLAVANYGSNNVSVLLNTTSPGAATPSFAEAVNFAAGNGSSSIAAADLNGDGMPDLAVANRNGNTVSVLLNTTSPGAATPDFAAAVNFAVGNHPFSIVAADLNGDGMPDLATANYNSANASVLLSTTSPGAATPSFVGAVNFATGVNPGSVATADLNGDGVPDLAVANYGSNNVSVLQSTTSPGAATPSFAAAVNFAVGDGSGSVAAADLNGDGRPDLATGNYDANSVSVLLNTSTGGAALIEVRKDGTLINPTVDLGTTTFGTTLSTTFQVSNPGSALLRLGDTISITPTPPAVAFAHASGFGSTYLWPGQGTTFTVTLDANTPGSFSGQVSFPTGVPGQDPFVFTVTGTVVCDATQYQTEEGGSLTCKACMVCAGNEYQITDCRAGGDITQNRVCHTCTACGPDEYQTTACQADGDVTTNRVCTTCTACQAGEYQTTACQADGDVTTNRVCTTCTACQAGEYQTTACQADGDVTTNRVCTTCTGCGPNEYQTTACQAGGDIAQNRVCIPCRTCQGSEYELSDCAATADRVCMPCSGACPSGTTFLAFCTAKADRICGQSPPTGAGQEDAGADTAVADALADTYTPTSPDANLAPDTRPPSAPDSATLALDTKAQSDAWVAPPPGSGADAQNAQAPQDAQDDAVLATSDALVSSVDVPALDTGLATLDARVPDAAKDLKPDATADTASPLLADARSPDTQTVDTAAPSDGKSNNGCSCNLSRGSQPGAGLALLVLGLALTVRRRRSHRR